MQCSHLLRPLPIDAQRWTHQRGIVAVSSVMVQDAHDNWVTSNQSVTARFDSNCSGGRSFDVRSHSWKMLANLFSCRPTSPLNMCTNPTKKSIGFRDASNCCCKVSLYRALHCTYGGKTNPLCVRSYIYQPFQLYLRYIRAVIESTESLEIRDACDPWAVGGTPHRVDDRPTVPTWEIRTERACLLTSVAVKRPRLPCTASHWNLRCWGLLASLFLITSHLAVQIEQSVCCVCPDNKFWTEWRNDVRQNLARWYILTLTRSGSKIKIVHK